MSARGRMDEELLLSSFGGDLSTLQPQKTVWDTKLVAFVGVGIVTLLYVMFELGVALYSGSLVLMSDGFHNLSDVISLGIAYWAQQAQKKPLSNDYTFGWGRAEILGGLTNACFLMSLCMYVVLEAIPKFASPESMLEPPEIDVQQYAAFAVGCGIEALEHANNTHGNLTLAAIDKECLQEAQDKFVDENTQNTKAILFIVVAAGGLAVNTFGTVIFHFTGQGHTHSHGGGGGHSHGGGGGHSHGGGGGGHSHGSDKQKKKSGHGHSHGGGGGGGGHSHGSDKKKKSGHGHSHGGHGGHGGHSHGAGKSSESDDDHDDGLGGGHGHSHGGHGGHGGHSHGSDKKKKKKSGHGGHGHSHGGGGGDAHDDDDGEGGEGKAKKDMNVHAVFLHYLGDMISSAIVLVAGLIIYFLGDQYWTRFIDPITSLLIVVLILWTTVPLIKQCSIILLQSVPAHVDLDDIRAELLRIEGLLSIHDFHMWQLVDGMIITSVHVGVEEGSDFTTVVNDVKRILHDYGIHSSAIQPEFVRRDSRADDHCAQNCVDECEEDWCCKQSADTKEAILQAYSTRTEL